MAALADECSSLGMGLVDFSSTITEPFCAISKWGFRLVTPLASGEWGNADSEIEEVAIRALIALAALMVLSLVPIAIFFTAIPIAVFVGGALLLHLASKATRMVGFALQETGYLHFVNEDLTPVEFEENAKVGVMNLAGAAGGISWVVAGVSEWRDRIEGIYERVIANKPQVMIFNEVYDLELRKDLIKRFSPHFRHIYADLGCAPLGVFGGEGGGMVLTNFEPEEFENHNFSTNGPWLTRSCYLLRLRGGLSVVGSHFSCGENEQERLVQVAETVELICKHQMPAVLAGDLNTELGNDEGERVLGPYFDLSSRVGKPTATNRFANAWSGKNLTGRVSLDEEIDGLLAYKNSGVSVSKNQIVPMYGEDFSLSDHHMVYGTVTKEQRCR